MKKYFSLQYWKGQRLLLLAFLFVHTVITFYYISQRNICFDEPMYMEYSKRWLFGKPDRIEPLDDSKSPITALAYIPRIIRQKINPAYQLNDYGRKDQSEGRYIMVMFSLLTALYIYKWCKRLYGNWWTVVALFLLDPLIIAYAGMINTDMACGFFLLAALYHFYRYFDGSKIVHFISCCALLGIGVITKQTLLFSIPLVCVLTIIKLWQREHVSRKRALIKFILAALIILIVINTAFYFHKSFQPLSEFKFKSSTFTTLQNQFSFLSFVPVPLPENYVYSLDLLKANASYGAGQPQSTYNYIYLMGNSKQSGGFPYYYLVVSFFKMPIVILLLLALIPIAGIIYFKRQSFWEKYIYLLLPVAWYLILLSFFNPFQTGLRHMLVIVPLLYVLTGFVIKKITELWKPFPFIAIAGVSLSVAYYYPYVISYTNEFVTNKKKTYQLFVDSNIDYGQSDSSTVHFIQANPRYKTPTAQPDAGLFIMKAYTIINYRNNNIYTYDWLINNFDPADHYQFTWIIYKVTEADLKRKQLK